jgi:hypothetical protein
VEKLQLWPTFPGKRLIKIYVALWESCRSIAPLQLLFLEIFHLVGNFRSYEISKSVSRNKNRRVVTLLDPSTRWTFRAAPAMCRARPVPAYGPHERIVVDPRLTPGPPPGCFPASRVQERVADRPRSLMATHRCAGRARPP